MKDLMKEGWLIPLITLAVNAVLGPIILSWMLRGERSRAANREDSVAGSKIHLDLIQSLQTRVASLIEEKNLVNTRYDELLTKYTTLIDSGQIHRREDLDKIETLEREIADVKGQKIEFSRKIESLYRNLEALYELVERLRGDPELRKDPDKLTQHMERVLRIVERQNRNDEGVAKS